MKLNCPICSTNIISSKSIWKYEFSELFQCQNCGIVYHVRDKNSYTNQVSTTYKATSWGEFQKGKYDESMLLPEISKQIQRVQSNLNYYSKFLSFDKIHNVLDIGAGIGLLEYTMEKMQSPFKDKNVTMIEPISENYQIIRDRYNSYIALNTHINKLKNVKAIYDVIFVQAVDYLFEDLDEAFKIIHSLLNKDGVLLLSRNAFIDMPCYYGGQPIIKAENLFSPNHLINAYFIEPHYKDFLQKNFIIIDSTKHVEEHNTKGAVNGLHYNYVLEKKTASYDSSALNETKYFDNYNKHLKKLLNK